MPNRQVRTYVHGTLYSLLARPAILEQAQQRGLADMLRAVSATSEGVFQRHIKHILEVRRVHLTLCLQIFTDRLLAIAFCLMTLCRVDHYSVLG